MSSGELRGGSSRVIIPCSTAPPLDPTGPQRTASVRVKPRVHGGHGRRSRDSTSERQPRRTVSRRCRVVHADRPERGANVEVDVAHDSDHYVRLGKFTNGHGGIDGKRVLPPVRFGGVDRFGELVIDTGIRQHTPIEMLRWRAGSVQRLARHRLQRASASPCGVPRILRSAHLLQSLEPRSRNSGAPSDAAAARWEIPPRTLAHCPDDDLFAQSHPRSVRSLHSGSCHDGSADEYNHHGSKPDPHIRFESENGPLGGYADGGPGLVGV